MRRFSFVFLLISFSSSFCFSQKSNDTSTVNNRIDTLLLVDGTTIITTILDTTGGTTSYKNPKHPKRIKEIETSEIFSVRSGGTETVLYASDSSKGTEYDVADMRYFILGQQDAKKYTKFVAPIVANFILSFGAGATGSFFSPLAPFAFAGLFSLPKIKIDKEHVSNPEYLNHETYETGYKQGAYKKRKTTTFIGGGVGLLLGIGTSFILHANGSDLIK